MVLNECTTLIITWFFLSIKYLINHPLNLVLILIGILIILLIAKASQTPILLGFLIVFIDGIGILGLPIPFTPFLIAASYGIMGAQTRINGLLKIPLILFLIPFGAILDIISNIPGVGIVTIIIDITIALMLSSTILATLAAIFSIIILLILAVLNPLFWILKLIGLDRVCSAGNFVLDKLFLSISFVKWKKIK